MTTTKSQMPEYKCHQKVRALKIKHIGQHASGIVLTFEDHDPIKLTDEWQRKHCAWGGGYYVVRDNGESTFIPKERFEMSYTRV